MSWISSWTLIRSWDEPRESMSVVGVVDSLDPCRVRFGRDMGNQRVYRWDTNEDLNLAMEVWDILLEMRQVGGW